MEYIKSYSDYKGKQMTNKVICDVTYILAPIMKFHNSLPSNISVQKMLPNDYNHKIKNFKGKHELIPNYWDIEDFIKKHYNYYYKTSIVHRRSQSSSQEFYRTLQDCNFIRHKSKVTLLRNTQNPKIFEDSPLIIYANGDSLSIYEPFITDDKAINNFKFCVTISKDLVTEAVTYNDKESKRTRRSSKRNKRNDTRKINSKLSIVDTSISIFHIYPFSIQPISKMMRPHKDSNRSKGQLLSFYAEGKQSSMKYSSMTKGNKNILCYNSEIFDRRMLCTYLSCPYLFLNSTEIPLKLKYQSFEAEVPPMKLKGFDLGLEKGESRSLKSPQYDIVDQNLQDSTWLSRLVMFNPEKKKNFKFFIGINDWKKVEILNIANNKEVIELNNKRDIKRMYTTISEKKLIQQYENELIEEENLLVKTKQSLCMIIKKQEKRFKVSLQMKMLENSLKWSKLIFITPFIYICNRTNKDLYIYHFPSHSDNNTIKYEIIKAMQTNKFYHLVSHFEYVKISFESKFNYEDNNNFSGLIKFIASFNEFYITLGDKDKETLLFVKIYNEQGFLFVVIKEKNNLTDYPYCIVNKLNRPVKFKQKEFLHDEEMRLMFDTTPIKKNILLRSLIPEDRYANNTSHSIIPDRDFILNQEIPKNTKYFTWDEPFMRTKKTNRSILELIFFGAKFKIDLDDIHEEITFANRKKYVDHDELSLGEKLILKGKIRIKDGNDSQEYNYELYDFCLFLSNTAGSIKFELHDKDLVYERKYNGHFSLRKGKEYEMFCVSFEETNTLADRIFHYIEAAKTFAGSVVIKKFVKNKSIFIEITKGKTNKEKVPCAKTFFSCNISNICLSFMQKNYEFMYIWLKALMIGFKRYDTDMYKNVLVKIKDYQIDHFVEDSHYPIILSPLSDKTYDPAYKDFHNLELFINGLRMSQDFYQIDRIYALISPMDFRLEEKFTKSIHSFINNTSKIFTNNRTVLSTKTIPQIIDQIDLGNYLDENNIMSYDTFVLIKQIMITDIKICFSLKFQNIDAILETSFLFLKPLIEELGLKMLNMDSSMFNFLPFIKNNIYQSSDEFMNIFSTFYFNQLVSELIKSLGGISSVTSMQLMDNLKDDILSNIRMEKNSIAKWTKRGQRNKIKELYQSGYENVATVVGGVFMIAFKMSSTLGRILSYLSFDLTYKTRRLNKINKSVKGFCHGISQAFKMLFFSWVYIFTQFYHVPVNMYKEYQVIGIFLAILIVLIGLIIKPIVGIVDLGTKVLESVAFTINDIRADRVRKFARYQRSLKENELKEYNSIDALAYTVKKYLDKQVIKANIEDISLALPGNLDGTPILMLFTVDRMILVEYDDYRFIPKYQIHFSECKIEQGNQFPYYDTQHKGKRIGFITDDRGGRYIYIHFDTVKGGWNCIKRDYRMKIKLNRFNTNSKIAERYQMMVDRIVRKRSFTIAETK